MPYAAIPFAIILLIGPILRVVTSGAPSEVSRILRRVFAVTPSRSPRRFLHRSNLACYEGDMQCGRCGDVRELALEAASRYVAMDPIRETTADPAGGRLRSRGARRRPTTRRSSDSSTGMVMRISVSQAVAHFTVGELAHRAHPGRARTGRRDRGPAAKGQSDPIGAQASA